MQGVAIKSRFSSEHGSKKNAYVRIGSHSLGYPADFECLKANWQVNQGALRLFMDLLAGFRHSCRINTQ